MLKINMVSELWRRQIPSKSERESKLGKKKVDVYRILDYGSVGSIKTKFWDWSKAALKGCLRYFCSVLLGHTQIQSYLNKSSGLLLGWRWEFSSVNFNQISDLLLWNPCWRIILKSHYFSPQMNSDLSFCDRAWQSLGSKQNYIWKMDPNYRKET